MLCSAYNEIWHKANVELTSLLEVELPKEPPKPEKVFSVYHFPQLTACVHSGQACGISEICYHVC